MATEGKGDTATTATGTSTTIPLHRQVTDEFGKTFRIENFLLGIVKMARMGLS